MAEKSPFFRNFASHILPVLTFATLLVGTALVGVALTRIPQRPTDAAPPSPAPETSYIAAGSLTGRTILVDPGHGGYDGGARCRDSGVWEKEVNLAVALAVEKSLTRRGATVLMTRRTDTDLCDDTTRPANVTKKRQDMQCRVDMAVQGQADMVLSIHMNEYRARSESGPQVFYRAGSGAGRLLAGTMQEALITALSPQKERAAMPGDYFILRWIRHRCWWNAASFPIRRRKRCCSRLLIRRSWAKRLRMARRSISAWHRQKNEGCIFSPRMVK